MAPIQIYASTNSCLFTRLHLNPLTMKSWEVEGLSIDDKYEIEEFRIIMKNFSDAATEGNLEEVNLYLLD